MNRMKPEEVEESLKQPISDQVILDKIPEQIEQIIEEKKDDPMCIESNEEEQRMSLVGAGKDKEEKKKGDEPNLSKEGIGKAQKETTEAKEVPLDDSNESMQFILENFKNHDQNVMRDFLMHVKNLTDQVGSYHWASKKRYSFDETSWKHLSRRCALLKAEGFSVRANTRKAKEKKVDIKDTRMDALLYKKKGKKKKKPE